MFLNRFSDNGNSTHNVMQIEISWILYITVWSHFCRKSMYFQSPNQFTFIQFSSVQSLSRVRLFATPWTTGRQASLSIINSQSSPKLMSAESVMTFNHLILCCPLLLLASIFPSIRVFSNTSKVMLTILQARPQQYVNQELSFRCHEIGLSHKYIIFCLSSLLQGDS